MAVAIDSREDWRIVILIISCLMGINAVLIARIYWVLIRRKTYRPEKVTRDVKTMIVAGSGGHTMEILALVSGLSRSYYPRLYIVADSDNASVEKIQNFEKNNKYEIYKIPRSREVYQSWITTVITTFRSFLISFPLVFKNSPDLILCNGPGTCIPICAAAFVLKLIGVKAVTVVYVESFCRVETLSLSGKILYYFADQVLVQWQQLKMRYPRTVYLGRLI